MRIRKMRRVTRKYSPKRRRFRRRVFRRSLKPEMKYFTVVVYNNALKATVSAAASAALYAEQKQGALNILNNIGQGADFDDRIGNRIFVKKISYKVFITGCPSASTYNVGDFYVRHIISDDRTTGTNASFFGYLGTKNFILPPDRKERVIHLDKTMRVTGSGLATGALVPNNFQGPLAVHTFSLNVNRSVEYTISGVVKNDRDVYSHAMIVGCPGMNTATNGYQIGCCDYIARIYYTDS